MYINLRTKERSFVHPCDEYYKQKVMQERRKRGGLKGKSPQPSYSKAMAMQQPMAQPPVQPKPIDPLVKMQQEKELKKLEEQKKK